MEKEVRCMKYKKYLHLSLSPVKGMLPLIYNSAQSRLPYSFILTQLFGLDRQMRPSFRPLKTQGAREPAHTQKRLYVLRVKRGLQTTFSVRFHWPLLSNVSHLIFPTGDIKTCLAAQ